MARGLARLPEERDRLELALALGVSEKRLLGWEPAERHEHYDAAGNFTGSTVVTRESEWDSGERARLLALKLHDRQVCRCGFHESVIDQDLGVMPGVRVCPVCAGVDQFKRKVAADNETADKPLGKDPAPTTPRAGDGQHLMVRQLSPQEQAEIREKREQAETTRRRGR